MTPTVVNGRRPKSSQHGGTDHPVQDGEFTYTNAPAVTTDAQVRKHKGVKGWEMPKGVHPPADGYKEEDYT